MDMPYSEDSIFIEGLRNGEEKAYMYLVDTYHKKLYAYALNLIDDHEQAQDIVQNVFLRTWQFRRKLSNDYSIKNFLYKSVYNEFVNTYKKNKAVTFLEQKHIEALSDVVEELDLPSMNKLITRITLEIENLPPKCQTVFILSKKEGLTNKEISKHLNISVKTVEAHISKAFVILKEKLDTDLDLILFILLGKTKLIT